jgi:hypothetical protein
MSNGLGKIKGLFRRAATSVEQIADGEEPVTTAAAGAGSDTDDDSERETSTNAQVEGAAGEPYSDDA